MTSVPSLLYQVRVIILEDNDVMNTMRVNPGYNLTDSYFAHEIEGISQQERLSRHGIRNIIGNLASRGLITRLSYAVWFTL